MIKFCFTAIALVLIVSNSRSQNKIATISAKDGLHYITTTIDHPVSGTYLFEGITEPLVQLNEDGSGIFQTEDLTKNSMSWGIECAADGTPKFQKGFNYAVYTLWYLSKNHNNENITEEHWTNVHFSIHFQKKKMFIMGDRSKDYIE